MTPDDEAWLEQVQAGHPPGGFAHRDHLRLALLLLANCHSVEAASVSAGDAIRAIAAAAGKPQKYNETVTGAWIRIVAHCRGINPTDDVDELVAAFPWLLDKRLLLSHYTSHTLASPAARERFVATDIEPIPA